MPARDLALLCAVAQDAGRIASGFFGGKFTSVDKPDNAGPVTEADLAVNRMLEDRLRAARPDYGWLSEESLDDGSRLNHRRVFIIDPIDGTRNFIEGGKSWSHSLAVAEEGRVIAAVVFLPMRDRLFAASRGAGATLNDVAIHGSARGDLSGATLLSARPAMEAKYWKPGQVPNIERVYRPSLAYRLALVAQGGRFDAMITLRDSWEWDIAAGGAFAGRGGRDGIRPSRPRLIFNNPRPMLPGVVAAATGVHGALQGALA